MRVCVHGGPLLRSAREARSADTWPKIWSRVSVSPGKGTSNASVEGKRVCRSEARFEAVGAHTESPLNVLLSPPWVTRKRSSHNCEHFEMPRSSVTLPVQHAAFHDETRTMAVGQPWAGEVRPRCPRVALLTTIWTCILGGLDRVSALPAVDSPVGLRGAREATPVANLAGGGGSAQSSLAGSPAGRAGR